MDSPPKSQPAQPSKKSPSNAEGEDNQEFFHSCSVSADFQSITSSGQKDTVTDDSFLSCKDMETTAAEIPHNPAGGMYDPVSESHDRTPQLSTVMHGQYDTSRDNTMEGGSESGEHGTPAYPRVSIVCPGQHRIALDEHDQYLDIDAASNTTPPLISYPSHRGRRSFEDSQSDTLQPMQTDGDSGSVSLDGQLLGVRHRYGQGDSASYGGDSGRFEHSFGDAKSLDFEVVQKPENIFEAQRMANNYMVSLWYFKMYTF